MLLRPALRHGGAEPAGARRRRRGQPDRASAGVYAGATQAYLGDQVDQIYPYSLRAITDVELFTLPAGAFALAMREWFPMAMHLLEGLFFGMRNIQTLVGERQRLVALGALSAGLTHELNNPAAAAVRATPCCATRSPACGTSSP